MFTGKPWLPEVLGHTLPHSWLAVGCRRRTLQCTLHLPPAPPPCVSSKDSESADQTKPRLRRRPFLVSLNCIPAQPALSVLFTTPSQTKPVSYFNNSNGHSSFLKHCHAPLQCNAVVEPSLEKICIFYNHLSQPPTVRSIV